MEDVAFGVEEEEEGAALSAAESVLSSAKFADTPEELLQLDDDGVPVPAMKFTAMHCSLEWHVRILPTRYREIHSEHISSRCAGGAGINRIPDNAHHPQRPE